MDFFGTDGIRDRVDGPLLAEGFVRRVGYALGETLRERHPAKPLHVVIGRDTRASGEALALWLMEGLSSHRIGLFDARVVPTPAVAEAVRLLEADAGVVLTASHNPATDNGIKLFAPGGVKWSDDEETALEARIKAAPELVAPARAPSTFLFDARRHYRQLIEPLLPENALVGKKIVVDTANGATCETTPAILEAWGATLIRLGDAPNGTNINDGVGSEHPAPLAAQVKAHGADLGLAHDGDGDRLVLVDECGEVVDGDQVLGILALDRLKDDRLPRQTLVVTIMSNLGLDAALEAAGGHVVRVDVGDRAVATKMRAEGFTLGGEQSGHIIDHTVLLTGDGLIAAAGILQVMIRTGKTLNQLRVAIPLYPQAKRNLKMLAKPPLAEQTAFQDAINDIERDLPRGRTLIRYSGTEPKLRLLVEGPESGLVSQALDQLEAAARRHLPVA